MTEKEIADFMRAEVKKRNLNNHVRYALVVDFRLHRVLKTMSRCFEMTPFAVDFVKNQNLRSVYEAFLKELSDREHESDFCVDPECEDRV